MSDRHLFGRIISGLHLMPWVVLALCTTLTLLVFESVWGWNLRRMHLYAELDAEVWRDTLAQKIQTNLRVVEDLNAFLQTVAEVDKATFGNYSALVRQDYRAVQALEWAPRVPAARRSEFETAARRDGCPDFNFTERGNDQTLITAGRRDEYFPVYFVEPYSSNEKALGYDLASDTIRKETLDKARDSGQTRITHPITLVQQTKGRHGVLIVSPIYRKGHVRDSLDTRRENLTGYALGVLDVDGIVESLIAQQMKKKWRFFIYDAGAEPSNRLLYAYPKTVGNVKKSPSHGSGNRASNETICTKEMKVADRTWVIVSTPTADHWESVESYAPWFVLIAGLLIGILISAYIGALAAQTDEVRRLVQVRTQELAKSGQLLRASEEKFASAFRNNPSPMTISSLPERRFLDANTAFLRATGYGREEVIGASSAELRLFADASQQKEIARRLSEEGQLNGFEIALRRKDGQNGFGILSANTIVLNERRVLLTVMHDVTARKRDEERKQVRQRVLEMLASNVSLKTIMEVIVRAIERESPGCMASILLLERNGYRLRHCAAPNLPDFYNEAVDGLVIGDGAGSCGTAAATKKTVVVDNVQTHPYWAAFRDLTQRAGIGACWSGPLLSVSGQVLGTFAIYHRTPHVPSDEDRERIQFATTIASMVIEHRQEEDKLQESKERFQLLVEHVPISLAFVTGTGDATFTNRHFIETFGYTLEDVPNIEQWWLLAYPNANKRQQVIAQWKEAAEKAHQHGMAVKPAEYTITCKDGSLRTMEVSGVRIHGGLLVAFMDLTARKEAEVALTKAAEQVRLALKSSGDGMWDWDLIHNRVERTERWYEVRGLDPREQIHDPTSWSRWIHPEDAGRVMRSFQNHVDGRTPEYREEYRIRCADGSYRWVFDRGTAIRNEAGRAIRILGFETDITERRQFEEKLRITQFAVDHIRDSVIWTDMGGRVIDVNDATSREFGYPREELMTFCVPDLDPSITSDRWVEIQRVLRSEHSLNLETSARKKSGDFVPVQVTANYFNLGDRETIFTVVQNISERKRMENALRESEERFRLTTTTARDAIVMLDNNGKITFWNKAAGEMFGYTIDEIMGAELHPLLAPKHYQEAYRKGFAVFRTTGQGAAIGKTLELVAKRKDGTELPVELSLSATQFGGRWHALAIMRDITDRRRVMEELHQAKINADSANSAKSQFLARMSHEIRTPLNAVLGFTQLLLRESDLAVSQRSRLEAISSNGEHLLALITDILDMSKIETGRLVLQPCTFNLPELLKDVEAMFRARTQTKQLVFGMEMTGEIPHYVCGDRNKIRQVLVNLIGNAVKFTNRGSIQVRVRKTGETAAAWRLQIEVEDTGKGISPEEINMLFQLFSQAKKEQQTGAGSGLGLYISRQFARLMEGDISVTSQIGLGSRFCFNFVVESSNMRAASGTADARPVKTLRPNQPPCRVLIVDDVKDNRSLLDQMLSAARFTCYQASSGLEALSGLKEWNPHLILMDVQMPGTDGKETIRQIRAGTEGKDVKIISVTAGAFEDDRQAVLAAGADAFLAKPIRQKDLFAEIKALLGVEYLYEDGQAFVTSDSDGNQSVVLTRESMAALPAVLINQMHEAVIIADFDRVIELIQQAEAQAPLVAQVLRQLAEQFDSEKLLELTEARKA